jgi:pimeloyl-ACP methyl ester carboxylesterase
MPQPPRRTLHCTGSPRARLIYDRWGQFGRPIILLHGLLFDRTMWWPAAAELVSGRCTVVAPDLPGHGDSPARERCELGAVAGEMAALVDRLGLHRAPIVVGHGSSAVLARAFADRFATHGLITLDEPATNTQAEQNAGTAAVDDLLDSAGLDRVPAVLRPYARVRRDPALLRPYGNWVVKSPGPRKGGPFAHLIDPAGFAARVRDLL